MERWPTYRDGMEREEFARHLHLATERAMAIARRMVLNPLPDDVQYVVRLNQSYDGNAPVGDEQRFPDDSATGGEDPLPVMADGVVGMLWRGGKVPEWVDVSVVNANERFTILEAECCGRYTATRELLYHTREGHPPFHVHSPKLPPRWSHESGEKFDLMWHEKFRRG